MTTPETVIAAHRLDWCSQSGVGIAAEMWLLCAECGWESERWPFKSSEQDRLQQDASAAHVLAALRERFAVVELPERGGEGWPADPDDDDFKVVPVHLVDQQNGRCLTGCRVLWGSVELNLAPETAHGLAAALLACLAYVEREGN